MKTPLKIILLAVALVVMNGCSVQRRAERHMRRAVALCPELVQKRSYLVDTTLVVPTFTDHAEVPFGSILKGDSVVASTDHGKIVLVLDKDDGTLHVGFAADEQEIHYTDTISYEQVVLPEEKARGGFWGGLVAWIIGIGFGMSLAFWLLRNAIKK